MKYETIMRRLMDAAYEGYNDPTQSKSITHRIDVAIDAIIAEGGAITRNQIIFKPLIMRDEGPIMTVAIFYRSAKRSTYGDIAAAGLVRLRSNHRVLAFTGMQLGWPGVTHYRLSYVEGAGDQGHKPTPAFAIGDLSQTDQALRYLMSCWALTGCRPEWASDEPTPLTDEFLVQMATLRYPASADTETYQSWPTDDALEQVLQPRLMAKVA